jgi:hypothetical protein
VRPPPRQGPEHERGARVSAIRSCFFQFLTLRGTPVGEGLPFAVARPRDETLPAHVVTLLEFDELTAHSGWLRGMYMLQPYPERLFDYQGVMLGKGRMVKALQEMLMGQLAQAEHHYQASAVTVRCACAASVRLAVPRAPRASRGLVPC